MCEPRKESAGALMLEDDAETERADLHVGDPGAQYRSRSGDSLWVLQYIEWNDNESAAGDEVGEASAR